MVTRWIQQQNALGFAHEIFELHNEIEDLKAEIARLGRYERLYNELLQEMQNHNATMFYKLSQLCIIMASEAPKTDAP